MALRLFGLKGELRMGVLVSDFALWIRCNPYVGTRMTDRFPPK